MIAIFPSLIAADLLNLQREIEALEHYCVGFHLDIMDFHFVPNLTWGPSFINAIRKVTTKKLFVHLMVDYPERYLKHLELFDHDIVSVHIESKTSVPFTQVLSNIVSKKWQPSVAINPETPLEAVIHIPYTLEHVLLMSVHPGFSNQPFLPHSIEKLKALNNFKQAHNLFFTIAMDGGIDSAIIPELIRNGASQVAVASAIFNTKDPLEALKKLSGLSLS